MTVDNIKKDLFDKSKYDKVSLKTGDIVSSGSPVYKIMDNDEWNIVAPLSEEQAEMLREGTVVTIKIGSLDYEVDCNYTLMEQADGTYINIAINKLMANFVDDRFLEVCILIDSPSGLKLPKSALCELDTYAVPLAYLTAGSNDSANIYLNRRVLDEAGELSIEQVAPVIYFKDDTYCYIDKNSVDAGDVFVKPDSDETVAVSSLSSKSLTGVYSANKGTAAFRVVSILNEKDDYCIVGSGVDYSISPFDYIILDSRDVQEGQIIY